MTKQANTPILQIRECQDRMRTLQHSLAQQFGPPPGMMGPGPGGPHGPPAGPGGPHMMGPGGPGAPGPHGPPPANMGPPPSQVGILLL